MLNQFSHGDNASESLTGISSVLEQLAIDRELSNPTQKPRIQSKY